MVKSVLQQIRIKFSYYMSSFGEEEEGQLIQ